MHVLLLMNGDDDALVSVISDICAQFSGAFTLHTSTQATLTRDVALNIDIVLCSSLPKEIRAMMPRLRFVQFWTAGVDGKLYRELFEQTLPHHGTGENMPVVVSTGSGVHTASCSEHVLAMMLAFARGIPQSLKAQSQQAWHRSMIEQDLFTLEGKTVGIVGAGQIGQAIAQRCKAFGMRTVGTRRDPSRETPHFDYVLSHLQYHDLILASDMIVLALPLTPHTRMLFGEEEIEVLRKGTYVFNIGRGGLWDEEKVITAVNRGWIAGVGVDVFVDEPLPASSPWWSARNTIITPHTGGVNQDYWERYGLLVQRQFTALLEDRILENRIDRDLGY